MGKSLSIKDFASKLGLSEVYVQKKIKPDFQDFEQDDPEGPLTLAERDRTEKVTKSFIASEAGREHFRHNRAKNEWHFKRPESLTYDYLLGVVRIWLKSRAKRAKQNESRCELNKTKPANFTSALPKSAFWIPSTSGFAAINRDRRSSTPPDEAESISVHSEQGPCQQRPRSESVESDDTNRSLPDIPCRQEEEEEGEDEELPDVAEILSQCREERSKPQTLDSPLRVHSSDIGSGLLSPPMTGRKRTYEVAAMSTTNGTDANTTPENIASKRARVTFAQTPSITMYESNTRNNDEQIDLTSETKRPSSSATTVRVNIPAVSRQRRNSHGTDFRSLQSSSAVSEVVAVENTLAVPENPQGISEESAPPLIPESTTPLLQPSHETTNKSTSPVHTTQGVHNSTPAAVDENRKIPGEECHRQPTIAESTSELTQFMPVHLPGLSAPEPAPEPVTSPMASSFRSRGLSTSIQPQPQPQPQPQTQRSTCTEEPHYSNKVQLSQDNLFAVLDFLHTHRKAVLSALTYDDGNYIERQRLDDKRKYLRDLEEDVEMQISRLNWACK